MNDDLISRKAAIKLAIDLDYESSGILKESKCREIENRYNMIPSAKPTEASCWGCSCPKIERLNGQKTFSEMVRLHDAETHDTRREE